MRGFCRSWACERPGAPRAELSQWSERMSDEYMSGSWMEGRAVKEPVGSSVGLQGCTRLSPQLWCLVFSGNQPGRLVRWSDSRAPALIR